MKLLWVGIAMALLLAGCGSSGSDSSAKPSATKTVPAVSLADTCPEIQRSLNEDAAGQAMMLTSREFTAFADDVDSLINQADPKAIAILQELSDRTRETGTAMTATGSGTSRLEGATEWLKTYKRVMSACEAAGAPIGLGR